MHYSYCRFRSVFIVSVCLVVSGCYGQKGLSDIKAYMADIKSQPHGRIEPLPEFHAYESFTYQASEHRSPFTKPVIIEVLQTEVKKTHNIYPNLDRPKEYLERFAVSTLDMVGTLAREEGELWALISDENGDVHRVKVGNYLGQNHGEIISVSEIGVQILEIVPDGSGDWVQRPRAIQIAGLEE